MQLKKIATEHPKKVAAMDDIFEIYKQAILRLCPNCTNAEWHYLKSGLTVKHYKARELFIEWGKNGHQLGYIASGLVRAYYVNDKGVEVSVMFAMEGGYATDYPSLLAETPSRYNFECLGPTTIVMLSYGHMQAGYRQFAGLERYGRLIAEEVLKMLQKRVQSFQFETAEERYLNFIAQNPALFNRISLTHLASFLGIERPSLSRIRSKISRG
ncbi:Crp/Fnr family transcriptional regulator [Flavobacterium subsaxonicum]|nr:Crp/Fnr family transcriptional regulator [Flavobacterium subsaxonicum]